MARGKTTIAAVTQDEKLEQALVPQSEQPYEVPENWIFFYFTSLIDVQGGTQPPKSTFVDSPLERYVRLVQIRDFATDRYAVYIPDKENLRKFNESDVMIARYGASLGRICRGLSGAYNVALVKTVFDTHAINPDYMFWLLQSECFQTPLTHLSRTAQAGFNKEDLSYFAIPLPPLTEQQRIVDRIESLFPKLDEAREKVQEVVDGFETRKSAILHKAFTGELTAKWRKEHGVGMDSWENVQARNICGFITKGETPTKFITTTGEIPFLKVYNIRDNKLDFDFNPAFIAREIHENKMKRSKVYPNDVIMNIVGPPLQKVAIVTDQYPEWNINQAIAIFRPTERTTVKYLYYCLLCEDTLFTVMQDVRGVVGQSNISLEQCRDLRIPLPSFPEQQEIVRIIGSLFEKEKQAKEVAELVLEQIELSLPAPSAVSSVQTTQRKKALLTC